MKPICIYHGNCADGFTAAWAVWKRYGDTLDYHPGVYGQAPPNVTGRDVLMVDFSYKKNVLFDMLHSGDVNQAHTILILDHHKTAQAELVGIRAPEEVGRVVGWDTNYWRAAWEQEVEWPVRAVFDMDRSGAQIAWDFFHPGSPRPMLVDYVGDRDLWKFELEYSREVNAYIFAHEYSFDEWNNLDVALKTVGDRRRFASMGMAIEKKHHKDIKELVAKLKSWMVIGGYAVPVANLPYTLTSDAGNLMATETPAPFAACYWDTPTERVFSLRSLKGGMDVAAIAAQYGGGGHANAAGFQRPLGWEGDK